MLKPIVVACLMMLLLEPAIAQSDISFARDGGGSLDKLISRLGREYLDVDSGVGLSIGIVENGQMHAYHFGTSEKDAIRLPNDETVYEIGSITKTFTGLLLARAVLDGKVKLDDEVDKYLAGEYLNLIYESEPVRLVHLANMTSGLPDSLPDASDPSHKARSAEVALKRAQNQDGIAKRDFLRVLHGVKLAKKPGNDPAHSNAAAELLGYVLENVYGDSWEVLVTRFIEKPWKMQSGAATADRPRARGYNDHRAEVAVSGAEAGLRYSTNDMLKFVVRQLDEGDEAITLSHRSTWDTLDGQQSIGFFWIVSKVDGGRRIRYSGGTSGFSSFCDLYPENKLGIVLLANNSDVKAQDRLQSASEKIAEAIREASQQR